MTRPLTSREIQLLRPIYGDQVRYELVTMERSPVIAVLAGAVTLQNAVHWNPRLYSEDFTREPVRITAVLVHEIMHVWQYQNLRHYHFLKAGAEHIHRWGRVYKYELDEHERLLDYHYEQQGQILQDYFHLKGLGRHVERYERLIRTALPLA